MTQPNHVWKSKPPERVHALDQGQLVCGDALEFLVSLNDECADVVFLDPPFNLGKKYGSNDKKSDSISESEYAGFILKILDQSIRILKPGGALYLYHLPEWALKFGAFLQGKLSFRHWIAVSMKNGFARGSYLYPAHYALLYFTKGNPDVFKRPKIPASRCRSCGEYMKDYGGYKRFIESGINLGDVWDDLSPVRHAKNKRRSSNELPVELTNRIIEISGRERGLLVDPFVGSGTSIISAVDGGMNFVACDREEVYCDVVAERLTEHRTRRPDATPVAITAAGE